MARADVPTVTLVSGEQVPRLGLGTWRMGERASERKREAAALKLGLDLGIALVDTAEMYGEGGAEKIVGEAIAGARERVFLVSKVYPHNASRDGVAAACERSLKRLGTDYLDLYLLHWRGDIALEETIEGFETLRRAGKVRYWGVSNFDVADMQQLWALEDGPACAVNQVYYNLARRWPDWKLRDWQRARSIVTMAYSPLDQGRLLSHPALQAIAQRHRASSAQVALAWLLAQDDVITIPKAVATDHVREIVATLSLEFSSEDVALIERAFPPPKSKTEIEWT